MLSNPSSNNTRKGHDFEVSETREDCVKEDLKTAAETREKDMKELLEQCNKVGWCSLKQGQEQQILHLIISFLSTTFSRFGKERAKCMEFFMEMLQDHIATSCILDNLDTLWILKKMIKIWKRSRPSDLSSKLPI